MIDFQLFHSDILEHVFLKLDEETLKRIIKFKDMKIIKYIYNNIPLDFDNEPIYKEMFIQKSFYKIFNNKFIISSIGLMRYLILIHLFFLDQINLIKVF